MADITMCMRNDCPLRSNCYRVTAQSNEHWQSYAMFGSDDPSKCRDYMPNNKRLEQPTAKGE